MSIVLYKLKIRKNMSNEKLVKELLLTEWEEKRLNKKMKTTFKHLKDKQENKDLCVLNCS